MKISRLSLFSVFLFGALHAQGALTISNLVIESDSVSFDLRGTIKDNLSPDDPGNLIFGVFGDTDWITESSFNNDVADTFGPDDFDASLLAGGNDYYAGPDSGFATNNLFGGYATDGDGTPGAYLFTSNFFMISPGERVNLSLSFTGPAGTFIPENIDSSLFVVSASDNAPDSPSPDPRFLQSSIPEPSLPVLLLGAVVSILFKRARGLRSSGDFAESQLPAEPRRAGFSLIDKNVSMGLTT